MRPPRFLAVLTLLTTLTIYAQPNGARIVVLGVTHSMQLANAKQQPAALRAFFQKVNPKALCVETTPEQYIQNDFLEFTYEQQYCLIPFAIKKTIPVYPFDWWPRNYDLTLALGYTDNEYPPFARRPNAFLGFLFFNDSTVFKDDLYYAESEKARSELKSWYSLYPEDLKYDYPRRLFLYRTFMQGMHIKKVADKYPGDTILVVVGSYHKDDIEKLLSSQGYSLINSASFGNIKKAEIVTHYQKQDDFATASFNLLGLQSATHFIDALLLTETLDRLKKNPSQETILFETRHNILNNSITPAKAIERYQDLLKGLPKEQKFTWTGVKNNLRIDSYFDPFGNMTVWQRIHLEMAREYFKLGDRNNYQLEKAIVSSEFTGLKNALLHEYIKRYVELAQSQPANN